MVRARAAQFPVGAVEPDALPSGRRRIVARGNEAPVPVERAKEAPVESCAGRAVHEPNLCDGSTRIQPDAGDDVRARESVRVVTCWKRGLVDPEGRSRLLAAGAARARERGPALAQILEMGPPDADIVRSGISASIDVTDNMAGTAVGPTGRVHPDDHSEVEQGAEKGEARAERANTVHAKACYSITLLETSLFDRPVSPFGRFVGIFATYIKLRG